jgi:hypothetical protein
VSLTKCVRVAHKVRACVRVAHKVRTRRSQSACVPLIKCVRTAHKVRAYRSQSACVSQVPAFQAVTKLLSPVAHSLTGAVLGLLLVFRTNSAYARVYDARCIWGQVLCVCVCVCVCVYLFYVSLCVHVEVYKIIASGASTTPAASGDRVCTLDTNECAFLLSTAILQNLFVALDAANMRLCEHS